MKTRSILLVVLLFACEKATPEENLLPQSVAVRRHTRFKGDEYEILVYGKQLIESPSWRPDADYPPLSPRKAQALAQEFAQKQWIVGDWRLRSIVLENVGFEKWIYVIRITQPKENDFTQLPKQTGAMETGVYLPVEIVVLMDGTVPPARKVQKQ
jgi:hypothetical protein